MYLKDEIQYVHAADGSLRAVILPADLWRKLEPQIKKLQSDKETVCGQEHNLSEFAEFKLAWNFPYSYSPAVLCPGCQAATDDWQNDPRQPFILRGAGIGGMLVFGCRHCGGTVRQKYFKDHMASEFTPQGH